MRVQILTPAPIRTVLTDENDYVAGNSAWGLWFSLLYIIVNALSSFMNAFETWSPYPSATPLTVTAGSMTISSLAINHAEFQDVGPNAYIYIDVAFHTGGVASNAIDLSLPVAPAGWGEFSVRLFDNGPAAAVAYIFGSVLRVQRADGANFNLSISEQIYVSGSYRTA